jgi:hypothetical protein
VPDGVAEVGSRPDSRRSGAVAPLECAARA